MTRFPIVLQIRSAVPSELDEVACLLAGAFQEPVTRWLVPDPDRHRYVMGAFFVGFAGDAFRGGWVDVAADQDGRLLGAALWFDFTRPQPDPDPRIDEAFGDDAERWHALDEIMLQVHPTDLHHYLFAIGVRPDVQGHGIGGQLLGFGHSRADTTRVPTYLEATTLDSRRLYRRYGYGDVGEPLSLPDGPQMWPLWRPGSTGCA